MTLTERKYKVAVPCLATQPQTRPGRLNLRGYSYTPKSDTISRFYTHLELDISKLRAKFQLVPQEMINNYSLSIKQIFLSEKCILTRKWSITEMNVFEIKLFCVRIGALDGH